MTDAGPLEEGVRFAAEGLELEGVLAYPSRGTPGTALLLLAPHPHMGGNMGNNVIRHLARRAAEDGCASLRFNYRGVGRSAIRLPAGLSLYDHWAAVESQQRYDELLPDAEAAFHALCRAAGQPRRRVLLGYSLGAVLAARLARAVRPTALVAVSPPVAKVSLGAFAECALPKLFVGGDRDFAFDRERFAAEFGELPDPKAYVPLDGCDHFYRRQEERLYRALAPFVLGGRDP